MRRHKYNAVRTGKYASKAEAKRAAELHLLEKAGEISDLREQVKLMLIPKDELGRQVSYIADFTYRDLAGKWHWEDVKGFKTPVYKLKRRLMWDVHCILIEEV